ncbi:hypothetical protein KP509_06G077900 [Ceratopteris richardii]|nr:hypothetical protein KP509_06G077900 [Ceratopteris richardii]
MGLNPTVAVKKCGKLGPAGVTISISHTEKETIVHTDCSNFREVVHQLTGASGNDGTLLPVTVSSRARVNLDDTSISLSEGADMGPRKPVPTKLFERRKSSKTLERITTNCRELPSMVPSPVTPLATDFERISLPMTPVTSPISVQQEHDHIQKTQQTAAQLQIGNLHDLHFYSSHNQSSTYGHANLTSVHPVSNDTPLIFGGRHTVPYNSHSQRGSSIEDSIIAEKGFFLHPQRPKTSEPPLLSLFPESPRG